MNVLHSKLPNVGTTIFSVMSKMAADYNAINLSQGFPDFPVSPKLIDLVTRHMKSGKNQYAPMAGLPALRNVIAKNIRSRYNADVNADLEVTITAGATEAIFSTLTAIISEGDQLILFDPAYDCYAPAVKLNGGEPIYLALEQPDFSIDWQKVRGAITDKTKAIIINSPHNPSGTVLEKTDLITLEKIAKEYGLIIISDEVYEQIIFGKTHHSALAFPELRKRCAAVFSFGKTFHVTGWKCGYVVAPPALTEEIRKVHQYVVFSVNTPMQYALSEYLEDTSSTEEISAMYNHKRKLFQDIIDSSRFKIVPCHGTYFQLLSYEEISDMEDTVMAEKMTKEQKIASIPISVFYQDKQDDRLLRFCFAKTEETLYKAGDILCKI